MAFNLKKVLNFAQEYLLYFFVFLLPWQTRYIFACLTLGEKEFEYGKLSIYLSEIIEAILPVLPLSAR